MALDSLRHHDEPNESSVKAWLGQLQQLRAELLQANPVWRCFHCGFASSDAEEARAHFGESADDKALCLEWQTMDSAKELQATIQQLNSERDENHRLRERIDNLEDHVKGIGAAIASRFKNCRTIDEAWHAYDAQEGRMLSAVEQSETMRAALVAIRDADDCESLDVAMTLSDRAIAMDPHETVTAIKVWREKAELWDALRREMEDATQADTGIELNFDFESSSYTLSRGNSVAINASSKSLEGIFRACSVARAAISSIAGHSGEVKP